MYMCISPQQQLILATRGNMGLGGNAVSKIMRLRDGRNMKVKRKPWMEKPFRNWQGKIPMPLGGSPRHVKVDLVPRVMNLVAGGVIAKPVWLDAVMAHPPPVNTGGQRPVRLEWREDDRLRRIWQRRNPEASMHPKVLFLDESRVPAEAIEHPANIFIRKQQKLMRRGLSEEEAYRRVAAEHEEQRVAQDSEVESARERAQALGAQPAVQAPREGLAVRLLRRFAEEARESGQPYPRHWFSKDGNGPWAGIGAVQELDGRTRSRVEKSAQGLQDITALLDDAHLDDREITETAQVDDPKPAEGRDPDPDSGAATGDGMPGGVPKPMP